MVIRISQKRKYLKNGMVAELINICNIILLSIIEENIWDYKIQVQGIKGLA